MFSECQCTPVYLGCGAGRTVCALAEMRCYWCYLRDRLSPGLLFDDDSDEDYYYEDEDDDVYPDYTCHCQHTHRFTDDQLRESKFSRPRPSNGERRPDPARQPWYGRRSAAAADRWRC